MGHFCYIHDTLQSILYNPVFIQVKTLLLLLLQTTTATPSLNKQKEWYDRVRSCWSPSQIHTITTYRLNLHLIQSSWQVGRGALITFLETMLWCCEHFHLTSTDFSPFPDKKPRSRLHFNTMCTKIEVNNWYTDLIDECHCIHQQLCIHSILLIQDLRDVWPQLCACSSKRHATHFISQNKPQTQSKTRKEKITVVTLQLQQGAGIKTLIVLSSHGSSKRNEVIAAFL